LLTCIFKVEFPAVVDFRIHVHVGFRIHFLHAAVAITDFRVHLDVVSVVGAMEGAPTNSGMQK